MSFPSWYERLTPSRALVVAAFLLGTVACAPESPAAPDDADAGVPSATEASDLPPELPTAVPALPSDQAEPAGSAPTAAGGEAKLALTETFTNTVYGYAIDYPTGWFVSDAGQTAILSSYDMATAPGTGGVAADQTKVDILALEGFPLDLEARVAQIESEAASAGAEVATEAIALEGGEPAIWLGLSGGMAGNTGIVVTILDGELYQLQAYGNPMPLPAIARTLRAAPEIAPE